MQISTNQFYIIVNLIKVINLHKDILSEDELKLLYTTKDTLENVFERHKESNKKTAEYIAKKRLTNKDYARTKRK